ELPLAATPYV
ncbi:hypothetical protein EC880221_3602, partial [Escherichia coli 88.0221]